MTFFTNQTKVDSIASYSLVEREFDYFHEATNVRANELMVFRGETDQVIGLESVANLALTRNNDPYAAMESAKLCNQPMFWTYQHPIDHSHAAPRVLILIKDGMVIRFEGRKLQVKLVSGQVTLELID